MLRLQPAAELALPPISPVETPGASKAAGCWTVKERRPPVHPRGKDNAKTPRRAQSSEARTTISVGAGDGVGNGSGSARGGGGDPTSPQVSPRLASAPDRSSDGDPPPAAEKIKSQAMKGRAIENWLNHRLGAANVKPKADMAGVAGGAANRTQGLSNFGIDAASLERLGLDSKSADRVYRAMFVYSQGLHAVLQEATSKSKNSSQALLVLWKAFTTVLEHAGQSEEQGAESLAALVQRGNEEEKARIENEYRSQMHALQGQSTKLSSERRDLQMEIQRLRDDETRLRNDNEMYRNDYQVAMSKYEREIKQRVDAEVRFLEKTRWADSLQEDLSKERKQSMHYAMQLQEANAAREVVQVEVDGLRSQVKMQEAQAGAYKQGALEAAQQKQRHEAQVGQYKQNLERSAAKIQELKDQLELEVDQNKRLTEQNANSQREMRKLETQFEDESHLRKELQNERDTLRERLDKMDREMTELTDERRAMQKEINDLSMKHRTDQIELKRHTETLERTEKTLEKLEDAHRKLVDTHRSLNVETDYLREDCVHFDEQLKKESELRKLLQHEKKQLMGQLQTVQIEKDTSQLSLQKHQKELEEITQKMVKLDSIVRDTKAAMTKVNLEHQVELKAHTQKVAILERVIADERNERRNLVAETQDLVEKRETSLDLVQKRDLEIAELKRHRLEKEEEADRFRILLKAQEQRNSEQLVIVDKYHAAVASHDAEMRQMHVLLECEREEAQRKLSELQTAYASSRQTLQRKIEGWKLAFEDVLSQLNFNPATEKIQVLEFENVELKHELKEAKAYISAEIEKVKNREAEITKRDNRIKELRQELRGVEEQLEESNQRAARHLLEVERQSLSRCDAEHRTERIRQNTEAFDTMKATLEEKIHEAQGEIRRLTGLLTIPKQDAEVQVVVVTGDGGAQTDLSYQYLECSERLQHDPRRLERLDALQRASHFVDDAHERRAFTVQAQQSTIGTTNEARRNSSGAHATTGTNSGGSTVAPVELRFDEANRKGRILHYVKPAKSGASSVPAPGPPRVAEPWPPPGRAPPGASVR